MALRISKRSYYALRAVYELASRRATTPITVADIADAQGIPPRFLEGILNDLRHAGLVASQRGNAGGYNLAAPAEKITVAEILVVTQGPISVSGSEYGRGEGRYLPGDSAFEELWESIDNSMTQVCRQITLADLVQREVSSERRPAPEYVI